MSQHRQGHQAAIDLLPRLSQSGATLFFCNSWIG